MRTALQTRIPTADMSLLEWTESVRAGLEPGMSGIRQMCEDIVVMVCRKLTR